MEVVAGCTLREGDGVLGASETEVVESSNTASEDILKAGMVEHEQPSREFVIGECQMAEIGMKAVVNDCTDG